MMGVRPLFSLGETAKCRQAAARQHGGGEAPSHPWLKRYPEGVDWNAAFKPMGRL